MQTILPKEKDTLSNEGNFSIYINNINLKAIEQQSNHLITKDTPIFCYVQENKQNFIAKFKDKQSTINISLDTTLQKDEYNNIIPQNPKNIFLSFIPFKDNTEANNTISQKLQLTSEDLNKGYKDIDFKLPLLSLKDCEMFKEWEGVKEAKEEVKEQYYIDEEGYLQGIKITKYLITRLEFTLKNGFQPKAIVLHRTNSSTAQSTLRTWSNPNNARVGTHFLIDTDGTIYQCASLYKYTQHVGDIRSKTELEKTWNTKEKILIENIWKEKTSFSTRKIRVSNYEKTKSYPNRYPINTDSIGIEVVGKYDDKTQRYPNATTKQLESVEQLVIILLELFNISKSDIYAHTKIAYKDDNEAEGVYLLEYLGGKL